VRGLSSACLISLSVRFSLFSPVIPVQIRVDVYSSVQRLYCQNYCHVARRSRRIKSAYQSVSSPDSTVTLPWLSAICSEGGVQAKNAFLASSNFFDALGKFTEGWTDFALKGGVRLQGFLELLMRAAIEE